MVAIVTWASQRWRDLVWWNRVIICRHAWLHVIACFPCITTRHTLSLHLTACQHVTVCQCTCRNVVVWWLQNSDIPALCHCDVWYHRPLLHSTVSTRHCDRHIIANGALCAWCRVYPAGHVTNAVLISFAVLHHHRHCCLRGITASACCHRDLLTSCVIVEINCLPYRCWCGSYLNLTMFIFGGNFCQSWMLIYRQILHVYVYVCLWI